MQQSCTYGSVRGASGNRRSYRDKIGFMLRQAQHERKIFNHFSLSSVHPEPVEGFRSVLSR